MKYKILSTIIIAVCHHLALAAQSYGLPTTSNTKTSYQDDYPMALDNTFYNLSATQTETIRAITQDESGTMWFAAGKMLYRYDGYDLRALEIKDFQLLKAINCCCKSDDGQILFGCEKGELLFDTKSMTQQRVKRMDGLNVRSIIMVDGEEWSGTDKGLYHNRQPVDRNKEDIEILTIEQMDDNIYAGCYDGVWKYSPKLKSWEEVNELHGILVSRLIKTERQKEMYVGTGNSLMLYAPFNDKKLTSIAPMPVVKSIGNYLNGTFIGTENGLYILNDSTLSIASHDARDEKSIAGDAIWSIFQDRDQNVWIGTDNGVSMIPVVSLTHVMPIQLFTHQGYGNQIYVMMHDSQGRWWMGGTHGIIQVESIQTYDKACRWYKMNDSQYPIPHNRIRCIYEDENNTIWVGGDGGLLHYDEQTRQFQRHTIKGDKNNWVYNIEPNGKGMMKVTTFNCVYDIASNSFAATDITPSEIYKTKPNTETKISTTVDGQTWLLVDYRIDILDKNGKSLYNVHLADRYVSIYYDSIDDDIYLGGSDKLAKINRHLLFNPQNPHKLEITSFLVNGIQEIDKQGGNNQDLSLDYSQNNLEIYFSDFDFKKEKTCAYAFKLNSQKEWVKLKTGQNCIILPNLEPGHYELFIESIDNVENKDLHNVVPIVTFNIKQPWYLSSWAWLVYMVLFLTIAAIITNNIIQRRKLRTERRKREIMVTRAKQKIKMLEDDNLSLQHRLHLQMLTNAKENAELSQDDQFLLKITKIVEDNIENPELSVAKLSELSGISTKQLSRKLKQMTNLSTVEFIRNLRLEKAALLLHNGRFTIAEVMYTVGFSNASYFTRSFVSLYKMTPTEYKEKNGVNNVMKK